MTQFCIGLVAPESEAWIPDTFRAPASRTITNDRRARTKVGNDDLHLGLRLIAGVGAIRAW
jgi:hypothetical protein